MESEAGRRLRRASDLLFSLEVGFTLTPADVTVEEFRDVRTLYEERDKYMKQQQERQAARNAR